MIKIGGTINVLNVKVGSQTAQKVMVGTEEAWPRIIEHVTSTNSSNASGGSLSVTVNLPSQRKTGDLMVMFIANYNGNMASAPSGWTLIRNDNAGTRERLHAAYKFSSGESNSTTATVSGSADSIAASVLLIRFANPTTPILLTAVGGSTSTTTIHATPTMTPSTTKRFILIRAVSTYVASSLSSNWTWPAGMNEVVDYVGPTSGDTTLAAIGIATRDYGAGQAVGVVNATSATSRAYGALTIAIGSE